MRGNGSRRGGALQPVDGNAKVAAEVVGLKEELLTKTTENKELADKAAALEAQLADMSTQLSGISVTPPVPAAAAAPATAGAVAAVPGVVRNPFAPASSDEAATKKAKKDVDHPKRPLSAYLLYCSAVRESVTTAHPDKKMTELSAILGAQWKALADADKAPYEKEAAKDKGRYEKEMVVYKAKKDAEATEEAAIAKYNEGVKAAAAMSFYEAHLAEEAAKAAAAAEKAAGKKKARKEEGAPKRAQSAYLIFAAEARESVKAANPNASATELMALIAAEWKATSEATGRKAKAAMARYTAAAEADRARYEKEMEAWKEAKAAEAAAARAAEAEAYEAAKVKALAAYKKESEDAEAAKAWKAASKQEAAATKAVRAAERAEKKEKKATAIKRPLSAYMFFCAATREAVKADLGATMAVTDITVELGRRWKDVSEADRAPFVAAAEADKVRYETAKAEAAAKESC
ncbi:hypothetical protein I4F81_000290 [Pyropia yezoensis]|uniref:Uncharacterized protein n=1 Tax=Pyropia yezoensis TaxID=2788 RepID=A0ACC3BIR9_PYRYE|nr:hypothetical protein I4F81_000290 [Neopyropia yezoensis]